MKVAITAETAFTPLQEIRNPVLVAEDGVISAIGSRGAIEIPSNARHLDFPGVLAPGFIDIHIHGGAGHDVMETDNLGALEKHLAKTGVTSYCPTTVTAAAETTLRALEKLGRAVKTSAMTGRARPIGVHMEGPFISKAKCGVHPLADIVPPSLELFKRFWQASQGTIKIMTIAPELPGADALITGIVQLGVRASLGHSDSLTGPAKQAIAAGASHATHTFNAMRALDHREPGILGVVLGDGRLSADIIVDGVHVAPEVVRTFLAAKGDDRAVLITDAISATGMPNGRYKLGTFTVEVNGDRCLLDGKLAGSVLTMDKAVRNVMSIAKYSLQRTIRLASLNPARMIGVDNKKGSLEVGKDADVAVLSREGQVLSMFVGGRQAE